MKKILLGLAIGLAIFPALGFAATTIDSKLVNRLKGRILLQTQGSGEAWYLNPTDGKRYYMKDGPAAYEAMRKFGMGITNKDLEKIPVGTLPASTAAQPVISPSAPSEQPAPSQPSSSSTEVITKRVNEDVVLSSMTLKFLSYSEKQSVSGSFGMKTAKAGAKFVVVNMNATNTTNSEIRFPYSGIQLADSHSRFYEFYDDTIGYSSNYIEGRDLAPSIMENGIMIFEVPVDATSYGVYIGGTSTGNYLIPLK